MNHVITTAGNIGYDAERHSQVFACDTCCFASQQGNGLTSSSSRDIALYRSQVSAAVSSCLVSRVCRKAASNPRYDAPRRSVRIGQIHMTVLQQGERHGKTRTTTVIANGVPKTFGTECGNLLEDGNYLQGRLPRRDIKRRSSQ